MANLAIISRTGQLTLISMAFAAFENVMHSSKYKIFMEIGCFLPSSLDMALRAFFTVLTFMRICVAKCAILALKLGENKRTLVMTRGLLKFFRRRLVAFLAFNFEMLAL